MHDFHGAAAEHVGRADHDRIADRLGDGVGVLGRSGNAALRLTQLQAVEQLFETVAVLGEVDGVGRSAEDWHARLFQRLGKF